MSLRQLHIFHRNQDFLDALSRMGVRYMVVGGLAVHFYCNERNADDLDILVEPSQKNGANVVRALTSLGLRHAIKAHDFAPERKVQIPLKHDFYLDLITPGPSLDFLSEIAVAQDVIIGRVLAKVASPSTLLEMLSTSTEPKHIRDIELLHTYLAEPPSPRLPI